MKSKFVFVYELYHPVSCRFVSNEFEAFSEKQAKHELHKLNPSWLIVKLQRKGV